MALSTNHFEHTYESIQLRTEQSNIKYFLIALYSAITLTLIICEFAGAKSVIFIIKPFLIPTLLLLYISASQQKNIVYMLALFATVCGNVLFLSDHPKLLFAGMISFVVYYILIIIVAAKTVKKVRLVSFALATLPFLFVFLSLLNLTMNAIGDNIYPAATNGVLVSVMCGLALSNYIFYDDKKSSYFAISAMLFAVLIFIVIIQKYYLANIVFQPLSALIFACGHYAFYKFLLEGEKE